VLISPQRPGRNLVHFPDSAGADPSAGVKGGLITPASARPEAEGTWAVIDLPVGRPRDLRVRKGDAQTSIEVDAARRPVP
jgi:hypothetical protein